MHMDNVVAISGVVFAYLKRGERFNGDDKVGDGHALGSEVTNGKDAWLAQPRETRFEAGYQQLGSGHAAGADDDDVVQLVGALPYIGGAQQQGQVVDVGWRQASAQLIFDLARQLIGQAVFEFIFFRQGCVGAGIGDPEPEALAQVGGNGLHDDAVLEGAILFQGGQAIGIADMLHQPFQQVGE